MYKFLFLFITTFCLGQSLTCFEEADGVQEIITNKVALKHLKYRKEKYNYEQSYSIDNNVKLFLSSTSSFIQLIKENKKISFSEKTKDKKNIFFKLEDIYYLKYKKETLYIFEFRTVYQGLDRMTFNVIFSRNKKTILFKKWNSSGDGISNAFGISNNQLFLLNQIRDSINYYQLITTRFKYNSNNSCVIKNDSTGKICMKYGYKF